MTIHVGDAIPSWSMDCVDPARMKTMAAILRDPYPVHWDRSANEAMGLGGRVINQGPLNLSYVVNMLLEWAGSTCIRRLTVSFARPVLDGDRVVACGRVMALDFHEGEWRAWREVWLERVVDRASDVAVERVVEGTAVVALIDGVGRAGGEADV